MPLQLNQKSWNDPKKIAARQETIINQYRRLFHWQLPPEKQYWSMCGQCTTPDRKQQEGCELHQMLEEKLITPEQFHGVDIDKKITTANRNAWPQANWYASDFYDALTKASASPDFNPVIINADFINMPERASGYFADIMALLSSVVDGHLIVLANVVLEYQRFIERSTDMEFTIEKLNRDAQFQLALKTADWKFDQKFYKYAGTGKESRTKMGTIFFYKGA